MVSIYKQKPYHTPVGKAASKQQNKGNLHKPI